MAKGELRKTVRLIVKLKSGLRSMGGLAKSLFAPRLKQVPPLTAFSLRQRPAVLNSWVPCRFPAFCALTVGFPGDLAVEDKLAFR